MSFLTNALRTGFSVLLGTNGEPLTFRALTVIGIVNRDPFDRVVRTPDFDLRDASVVEFLISAVSSVPKPGEQILDRLGCGHRIKTVRRAGDYYQMECQTYVTA